MHQLMQGEGRRAEGEGRRAEMATAIIILENLKYYFHTEKGGGHWDFPPPYNDFPPPYNNPPPFLSPNNFNNSPNISLYMN